MRLCIASPPFARLATVLLAVAWANAAAADEPVADDFGPWFIEFQAVVASRRAEAVADHTRFPFESWDLVGKLPDTATGGPVVLDRAGFVDACWVLFDREARKHVAKGRYAVRTDQDEPFYSLEIWQYRGGYTWVDFAKGDDGKWALIRTDNVSE